MIGKASLAALEGKELDPAPMLDQPDVEAIRAASRVLSAAADFAPTWRGRAERAEAGGALPRETIEELFDAGLLQMLIPRRYGGLELGWRITVETSRLIARACASTGWIVALGGGHAAAAARLPLFARDKVFGSGSRQLISTATPSDTGLLRGEAGAFSVGGTWHYCTGIDHATWVMARCYRPDDLERRVRPSHFALLDPQHLEIRGGAWGAMGMRATGSKSFAVVEQGLDDAMCATLPEVLDSCPNGGGDYAYNVPFRSYYCTMLIGPILGCAEGALKGYVERMRAAPSIGSPAVGRLGESSAMLSAAAGVYGGILSALHAAGAARQSLSAHEQARLGRDRAYMARLCMSAVQSLMLQAGTRAEVAPIVCTG